jgi:hypothetical protein
VYYWLKRKGCIGEDVNHLIRKCFTVEQQQKVTKSKYIKEKGIAVMKETVMRMISSMQRTKQGSTSLSAYLKRNNVNEWPNPDIMNRRYPSEKPR